MIPIPGVTLRLYFDGLEMDVSELLRIYDPVDRACNEEFRHAASSRSVTLRYDSLLASRLTSARDIRAEIDVDSVRDFTGRVAPSAVIDSGGAALGADPDVEDIPLEIDDLSALLDTEITMENGIVIDHAVVCDGTLPATSIVHRLLAFAGVSNALTHTIDVELRAVAVDSGTVREHLDTILGEYGYAWRLNEYGQVILVRWMHADPVPTAALNEDNLVGRLKAERLPIEADAVEINWYALKERSQALVYMADLPFGDDNRRSGWPIVPDYLWPEEANAGHAWWEFRDAALASRVNERGAVIPDGDYTSIVTTVNHTIDELFEDGIVRETAVFENRRARVAYRNPEAESKLIYHCNILADVVYRGARNSERADLAFDAKTVDSYDSLYIHDAINAAALCAARATRLKSAAWRYAGVSEDLLAVGTIVAVNDPYSSVSGIAIIIERRHEIETGLYHYRAVGLAANSVTPVSGTTTVLPAPDLRETTGPEGATGRRTALLTLYKWAASAPSSSWPTGSSTYTWATGGWTNPATLNGWVQAPGAGAAGQTLYAVDCLVSDEATTATTAGTWPAAPAPYAVGVAGATGPTGPQGNTGPSGSTPWYSYHANAPTSAPATPTGDGTTSGWTATLASTSVWVSVKYSVNRADAGTWSTPAVMSNISLIPTYTPKYLGAGKLSAVGTAIFRRDFIAADGTITIGANVTPNTGDWMYNYDTSLVETLSVFRWSGTAWETNTLTWEHWIAATEDIGRYIKGGATLAARTARTPASWTFFDTIFGNQAFIDRLATALIRSSNYQAGAQGMSIDLQNAVMQAENGKWHIDGTTGRIVAFDFIAYGLDFEEVDGGDYAAGLPEFGYGYATSPGGGVLDGEDYTAGSFSPDRANDGGDFMGG